jgi:hypothetical protein
VGTLAAGLFGLAAWIDAWRHPTLQQRLLWMALAALAVMIVFIPSFLAVSADIFSSVVSAISEKPYYHSLTWGPMKQFLLFNCVTLLAIAGVLLSRDLFGDRKRRIVLAIVLIVFMIAANIPGFFPVGTQWQYYIINVQMWLGLPALAALVSLFAAREGVLKNGWVKEISIIAAVLATFVGLFGFAFFKARYVDNMHASRGRMLQARANGMVKEREKVLEEIVAYRERFGARLRVYAPSTHSAFWEWVPHCEARSMTIPAITAVPMIQGYPPLWTECAGHIQLRGWQVIAPRVRDDVLSDEALCRDRATTSEDALAVYVLESLTETRHNRLVDCSGRS